jgi:hypothetical protein
MTLGISGDGDVKWCDALQPGRQRGRVP